MDASIIYRPPTKTLKEEARARLHRICREYNEARLWNVLRPWEMVSTIGCVVVAAFLCHVIPKGILTMVTEPHPVVDLFLFFACWVILGVPVLTFIANACIERDARFGGVPPNAPLEERARSLVNDPGKQRLTDVLAAMSSPWVPRPGNMIDLFVIDPIYSILHKDEQFADKLQGLSRIDQVEAICTRALFLHLTAEREKGRL
jgi:hypothetical protein